MTMKNRRSIGNVLFLWPHSFFGFYWFYYSNFSRG